jgi:hypothetical protein
MAEILVFTLLAAIAGIYSILPEHRQLRVRYSLSTKPRLGVLGILGLAIVATYWLSILVQNTEQNVVQVSILDVSFNLTSLYVESAQLFAVLMIVGMFLSVFLRQSVKIRNEENLLEIQRDLYNREEYSVLTNLIEENYEPLINHPQEPVHPNSIVRWPESLVDSNDDQDDQEDDTSHLGILRIVRGPLEALWQERIQPRVNILKYYIDTVRYRTSNTAEEASDYTEALLLDANFSEQYSGLAEEIGLRILSDDSLEGFKRRDVVHLYLRKQLETQNSLLYRNLKQNTHLDGYKYKLKEENRLVFELFRDFERAEKLDIYKPVGDRTREIIRNQRREDFDQYNERQFSEVGNDDDYIFNDPVFIGIQFFDVMVREAFDQGVDWHVWLSYYESYTKEICRNYQITEYSDPDAEWPNDYSRLLYEMNSNMLDWLKMVEEELKPDTEYEHRSPPFVLDLEADGPDLDDDSVISSETESGEETTESGDSGEGVEPDDKERDIGSHVQLGRISTDRGSRNIPEMTVIVLFSCHNSILTTDEIPIKFMSYLTKSIFLRMLDFREHDEGSLEWKYSEFMLHCLEENLTGRRSDPVYRENLKRIYHGEYGGLYEYGVRNEILAKDTEMTGLRKKLDELIGD